MFASTAKHTFVGFVSLVVVSTSTVFAGDAHAPDAAEEAVAEGKELFTRVWRVRDARSPKGDGLGPLFNGRSCVECHSLGGAGGGGDNSKNVTFASVAVQAIPGVARFDLSLEDFALMFDGPHAEIQEMFEHRKELHAKLKKAQGPLQQRVNESLSKSSELIKKNFPEFEDEDLVVVHKHGASARNHRLWQQRFVPATAAVARRARQKSSSRIPDAHLRSTAFADTARNAMHSLIRNNPHLRRKRDPTIDHEMTILSTRTEPKDRIIFTSIGSRVITFERNSTAIFGAGLLDAIPDEALVAAAEKRYDQWPKVSGRVSKLEDGRIGRFGWKADKASLRDFTVAACALELGLQSASHDQAKPHYDLKKTRLRKPDHADLSKLEDEAEEKPVDLTEEQVDSLTAFLASLPAPEPSSDDSDEGKSLFRSVGCAACHLEQMASADGIYSDLLLHDMGHQSSGFGGYGSFMDTSTAATAANISEDASPNKATPREWRTPPLWGVRHSAPYMHDGRAADISQAIALHGGEAKDSAKAFFRLSQQQRNELLTFVTSL